MVNEPNCQVLTPDFYEYPWVRVSHVEVEDRFAIVVWPDGTQLRAFDLWLRENAVGAGGVDIATREGLLDPADHHLATAISTAHVTVEGAVEIQFAPDQTTAVFHPGWLRHVAEGKHLASSWVPDTRAWRASELPEPPTHDGHEVLASTEARRLWLNDLVARGIARLRGLPDDADVALQIAQKVGAIRDTNFGAIWDVKADVSLAGNAGSNSTANTSLRLGPHTDLPTRETPPGFQFLHCFQNQTEGGYSTMADGAAVVAELQRLHPGHYEALTTLRWIFFNRGPGIDHRWSGPLIDLGVDGSPLTLRAFYPVRAFPDMDPADMARAYEAMRCFSTLAASDEFQMRYPFEAGDMVGFDNRRILHGRDAFSAGGVRHLRGIYIDHDEVLSTTRVLNRHSANTNQSKATQTNQEAS